MPVLKYSFPAGDPIVCSNIVCQELAEYIVHRSGGKLPCCAAHLAQFSDGMMRLEKLIAPGRENEHETLD